MGCTAGGQRRRRRRGRRIPTGTTVGRPWRRQG
uniref:Uncharacterized protein n=1 Tax=Arundo donax TaxID=35708 RepID=A0A0A9GI78_ARUDO